MEGEGRRDTGFPCMCIISRKDEVMKLWYREGGGQVSASPPPPPTREQVGQEPGYKTYFRLPNLSII